MRWLNYVAVFFALLAFVGCGGTKQDPYADQSDAVKKAHAYVKPEPKEKPLATDVLRIDGTDYYIFQEGVEGTIDLKSRCLFDKTEYFLEVLNQGAFQGMQVITTPGDTGNNQMAELHIKWTPPKGITYDNAVSLNLETQIYTKGVMTDGKSDDLSHKKNFAIIIYKESLAIPEIISIDPVPGPVKEGATSHFLVKVKDMDSTNSVRPSLVALTDFLYINGSPYLKWNDPVQDQNDPAIWKFDVVVDLKNAELTTSTGSADFSLAVLSAAGKKSAPKKGKFTVWTSVTSPVTSWTEEVSFTIGQKNTHTFTVIDPRGEGVLTTKFLTSCSALPGAPQCTCNLQKGVTGKLDSAATCSINWTVPVDATLGNVQIQYEIQNSSPVFGDKDFKKPTFTGNIRLVNP